MIGIIGAMQEEIDAILELTDSYHEVETRKRIMYLGTLGGKKVVICKSGIGKVEAAYTTSVLLSAYKCFSIINVGSAGGLLEQQEIGDIVISDETLYHDFILDYDNPKSGNEERIFKPDKLMVKRVLELLEQHQIKYWVGQTVSGDAFISSQDQVDYLHEHFPSAICADMEGAAIGHICTINRVPFMLIRSLSDVCLRENNQEHFEQFLSHASKMSAQITEYLVASL
ncbi:MAG TPA: 5'-methylthioadenosine/adenosylhomocysteine nucleosidase [Erysipelothrix sp.]|nr:5'-methylthioadenosine/adenosylhomocysteine nucleosidase [Erysipelothrix sp.]